LSPKTIFRKAHLVASGYTKNNSPFLYAILYDFNLGAVLGLSGLLIIWFCFTLRRGALRYQFTRLGYSVMISLLAGIATT